ncbi:MAG: hypothetical protein RLZZ387_4948 [Chloroflexota bacterium]|jgi:hypothetical protein
MINPQDFTRWLDLLLAEAFGVRGETHGFFLDDGRSGLLAVLDGLSADAASDASHGGWPWSSPSSR